MFFLAFLDYTYYKNLNHFMYYINIGRGRTTSRKCENKTEELSLLFFYY